MHGEKSAMVYKELACLKEAGQTTVIQGTDNLIRQCARLKGFKITVEKKGFEEYEVTRGIFSISLDTWLES